VSAPATVVVARRCVACDCELMWLWRLRAEPNTLTCETPRCLFNYRGREQEVLDLNIASTR
jgi:hypothetical protein